MNKFLIVLPFDRDDAEYNSFADRVKEKYPLVTQHFQLEKHVWAVAVESGFSYTIAEELGIGTERSGFVFPITSMAGKYDSSFVEWYNG